METCLFRIRTSESKIFLFGLFCLFFRFAFLLFAFLFVYLALFSIILFVSFFLIPSFLFAFPSFSLLCLPSALLYSILLLHLLTNVSFFSSFLSFCFTFMSTFISSLLYSSPSFISRFHTSLFSLQFFFLCFSFFLSCISFYESFLILPLFLREAEAVTPVTINIAPFWCV
jgi:hypothetical protein